MIRPKTPGELGADIMHVRAVFLNDPIANQEYATCKREFEKHLGAETADDIVQFVTVEAAQRFGHLVARQSGVNGFPAAIKDQRHVEAVQLTNAIESVPKDTRKTHDQIEADLEKLRDNTLDLSGPVEQERVDRLFPSGSWLLHSTRLESVSAVLRSGQLKTTATLMSERIDGNRRSIGGSNGVSWNYNRIESLLGDARRMIGFMADPQTLLENQGGILAVPQLCAWDELQYYNAEPEDIDDIRDAENMLMMADGVFQLADIVAMSTAQQPVNFGRTLDDTSKQEVDKIVNELNTRLAEGFDPQELRRYYVNRTSGFAFAPHLGDCKDKYTAFVVFLQAAADGCFGDQVAQSLKGRLPSNTSQGLMMRISPALQKLGMQVNDLMKDSGARFGVKSNVAIENTIFYCPSKHLYRWQKALAETTHQPRGIVAYDGATVRIPSAFANRLPDPSKENMTKQLRVINKDSSPQWRDMFTKEPHASGLGDFIVSPLTTATAGVMQFVDGKLSVIDYNDID